MSDESFHVCLKRLWVSDGNGLKGRKYLHSKEVRKAKVVVANGKEK